MQEQNKVGVTEIVKDAEQKGELDYRNYISLLSGLNERQISNIFSNLHTRVDSTLTIEEAWGKFFDWDKLLGRVEKRLAMIPTELKCLLACPLVAFRFNEFLNWLQTAEENKKKNPVEAFFDFAESFPTKTYYRALRVKPEQDISFITSMLMAPKIDKDLYDSSDGSTTYGSLVGDFDERFSWHLYFGRSTKESPFVSWTEDLEVAKLAATGSSEVYDPEWHSNENGKLFVMKVEANSFYFLDETQVNESSEKPLGREALVVLSLPFSAIEKGGISFEFFGKK